jgi:glycine C-acetyltransferase
VAGIIKALDIVESEPELRKQLWENTTVMQNLLKEGGVDIGKSNSQVIPIMIRDDEKIFALAEEMLHEGVYLNPVRYPAVSKHRSRFRISVTAAHSRAELEEGARIIIRVLQRNGLCH